MYRAILNGAHFRLLCYVQRLIHKTPNYSTTVFDTVDAFSYLSRNGNKEDTRIPKLGVIYNNFSGPQPTDEIKNSIDLFKLSGLDLDNALLELHDQNKHKQILRFVNDCIDRKIIIGKDVIKKLFRLYSLTGRVEAVGLLQNYCSRITPDLHKKNGEFAHYIAKAQCMKGNSKEGLTILTHAYKKNVNLRAFYRIIFKELIHDSVMNRSEASLVNFKKYVLEFSSRWKDNYPLVCFWHICWESDWFSDQMLADELLEASEDLQKILGEMSLSICLNSLQDYNEDAVARLLQSLLKYKKMDEYKNVLQILFNYRLKNKDLRGCTEILRNCKVLGISLPSHLQSHFITLFIGAKKDDKPLASKPENFKLKF